MIKLLNRPLYQLTAGVSVCDTGAVFARLAVAENVCVWKPAFTTSGPPKLPPRIPPILRFEPIPARPKFWKKFPPAGAVGIPQSEFVPGGTKTAGAPVS